MEEKIDRIYKLVIVSVILLAIILLINLFGGVKVKNADSSSNTSSTNNTSKTSNEYDVSSFNSLSLSDLLKLFDNKKETNVVYLGRATCSACVSFLPTLQSAQSKHNYTTQYLDITTVDSTSQDFEKLMTKLSKEVTLSVNGESKTQSFGDFYGYTPMVFVIKDGKFSDGFVGAYSEAKFEEFLNKNGIK